MNGLPVWVEAVTALFAVIGAVGTLIGAIGLVRLPSFFQRAHAPTLGSTGGAWSLAVATALQQSYSREQVFLHAVLIPLFIAATAPITAIFLLRAGLFRSRRIGATGVPPITTGTDAWAPVRDDSRTR